MFAVVEDNGKLVVHTDEDDLCFNCKHLYLCPLMQAIAKEYVFMHYSDVEISKCALFKKK